MNMTYLRQTLLSSGTDKGELLLNIDLFTMVNKTTCNRVYKSELLLNIDLFTMVNIKTKCERV